jgi:peptide deformylase
MAVREILLLGNPVLRVKCEKVKNFPDSGLRTLIEDLRDTLTNFRATHGFGRGIAAPQIGITKRIIVINIDAPIVLINPEIVKTSRQSMTLWDDCFSFPDLLVKVKRHLTVTVAFQDEKGKKHQLQATDGLSELLQHEVDHLHGILAIDRAVDSHHITLRSEWEKMNVREPNGHQF